MKKILLFILISFFSVNQLYWMNPADLLNKIPQNFKSECYKYYNKIDRSEVWNNSTDEKYKTYKINLDKTKDLVITQFGFILPYKFYSENNSNIISYNNNQNFEQKYLSDFNKNTYIELDTKTQSEIILNFEKKLEKDTFSFNFNYSSDNLNALYYISIDNKSWDLIEKNNISDFSFKYLKINFVNKDLTSSKIFREIIKIYELSFTKNSNTILLKSFYNDDIEFYSSFDCKTKDFNTKSKSYNNFEIDKNTKTIEIKSENNPKYDVFVWKDYDNDWVLDEIDNCKYRYNPNQTDTNWDWIWDICSDDDKDWIIWFYDNCINIYNPLQKDVNRNNVWDICEFDKDKDWVFDKLDNCINTANPNQKDSDNDWIWDTCDNCSHYNPAQIDKNNNEIWDVCEEIEKKLLENDIDWDWIIDYKDNCKYIANKNQIDTDRDSVWDMCDNCLAYQNKNQLDFDENWIWDICEDSDWDSIEWLIDNCINVYNPDQKDSDNDWIWDLCEDSDSDKILFINDNCPYDYNPDQSDIDWDKIWDKCDPKDNRFIESNKEIFVALLILFVLIFGFAIFHMLKKLK